MLDNASAAAALVVMRSMGRRSADAATAIATREVAGCGRGRPRPSHTAKATNTGGATESSWRSVMWSTNREANTPTSTTVTTR